MHGYVLDCFLGTLAFCYLWTEIGCIFSSFVLYDIKKVCLCVCQTSARWSYVCWLTFPLTLNCSTFLPTPRSTSLPCWPVSGRSLSLSRIPRRFSSDILAKVSVDTPQGFSFPLTIPGSTRLPTASLQMLISLLP